MIEYTVKVYDDGTKFWYLNGKRHREDGPATEWASGNKAWYLNGKLHREDGPAIEDANGYKAWFLNGNLHREDGPAIEDANGGKEWYLNGEEVTEEEHKRLTSKVVEMTMEEINKALGKQVKVVQ
jgi:endo-1,4-beta-mannosidase